MKDESPHIRFQAIVVCSRAVEQMQTMIAKLRQYEQKFGAEEKQRKGSSYSSETLVDDETGEPLFKKIDFEDHESLIFSAQLFEMIGKLLGDPNQKVKLSAAIAVFIILRSFVRPLKRPMQTVKNQAEQIVRAHLFVGNKYDCYMAAQCLALDGICESDIVQILLKNYFASGDQFTKQQVTKTLSDLSRYHVSIFWFFKVKFMGKISLYQWSCLIIY